MTDHAPHVFRFFVDAVGAPGAALPLAAADAQHADVLRLASSDVVEVVDSGGAVWEATITSGTATLGVRRTAASARRRDIVLVAGALVGGRFDELVDAAVQAGATSIVPLAHAPRDRERLGARRARLERIARSAAKQAKRDVVPTIGAPISPDELPAHGIVVDPAAPQLLDAVVRASSREGVDPITLLVGSADGLDAALVDRLAGSGWQRGRLGPTILRSELAAGVAVAIAAMHAPALPPGPD